MKNHHIYNNFFKDGEVENVYREINNELQDQKLVHNEVKRHIRHKQMRKDTTLSHSKMLNT